MLKTVQLKIEYDDLITTELQIRSALDKVLSLGGTSTKMSKFKSVWQTLQSGKLTDAIKMYESTYGEPIQNNTAKSYLTELVHQNFLVRYVRGYYKLSTFDGPVDVREGESCINKMRRLFDVTPQLNFAELKRLYRERYGVDVNTTTLSANLKALVGRGDLIRPMRNVYHRPDAVFDPTNELTTSNIDKMRRLFDVMPQLNFADVGTWYKMIYGEDVPTATLTTNLRTLVDRGNLIRPVRGVYHHPDATFNPVQATPVSECDRIAHLIEGFGSAGINRLVMEFPKVYGRKISTASVRNYVVKLHKSGKVERVRPGVYQWKGE